MAKPLKKVTAGFQVDMNTLLARYSASKSVRFSEFAKCFREAKFSLIFCARKDPRELRLMVEEMVSVVLKLWAPTTTFPEKVFGLYMLYAIYTMQPLKPKAKLRLKLCHMSVMTQLLHKCEQEQHLDACYIINRLYMEKCFFYTASVRQMSPMMTTEKEDDTDPAAEVSGKTFSHVEMFGTMGSTLEQLSHIHDEYVKAKSSQQSSDSVRELTMISDNLFANFGRQISLLRAKYRAIEEDASKATKEVEDTPDEEHTEDIGTRRTRLRDKVFRSAGNTRLKQRQDELLHQDDSSGNLVNDASKTGTKKGAKPAAKKRGRPSKKAQASTSGGAESVQSGVESNDNA
ncbi:snRNA-activating protein complex subunit 1-like isoform X1 [Haemaphysalis longicornis]